MERLSKFSPPQSPHLLNCDEAAKRLAMSTRKLWSLKACGEIAFVQIGRSVRYTPDDLADFIAANRTGGQL